MNILAIESSCDETAAAVVWDGRTVLSNCIASQIEMHTIYGGVVPEIASRKHVEAVTGLADQAVDQAGLTKRDLDAVAVTYGPGLIGAVLVGVNFAKGAAMALDLPLIPVHHVRGHIAANYITHPELEPPFVCLCVSGGNTMLVDVRDYTDMAILGATRDDAAGECFDKVARVLGIGYPGGAPMDALAQGGDDRRYELPRAHVADAPLDMSFSGLKTAVLNLAHNAAQKGETLDLPGLAASFAASPYAPSNGFALLLGELCGWFYHFKNTSLEPVGDDGLVAWMRYAFDHRCMGQPELLQREWERRLGRADDSYSALPGWFDD